MQSESRAERWNLLLASAPGGEHATDGDRGDAEAYGGADAGVAQNPLLDTSFD